MSIKIKTPVMPEPGLFSHELISYQKDSSDNYSMQPDGIHLGTAQRGICEQAHIEGETCDVVHEWYSAEQLAARDAQWLEMVGPLVEALEDMISAMQSYGFPFSPEISSARAALSAITEE